MLFSVYTLIIYYTVYTIKYIYILLKQPWEEFRNIANPALKTKNFTDLPKPNTTVETTIRCIKILRSQKNSKNWKLMKPNQDQVNSTASPVLGISSQKKPRKCNKLSSIHKY